MRIGSVPAFFSPIFLNRALIEMCFYDSYPVFWEHSDLENPLQHQTSTTLLWLLRENPSTLPLSCSRCCVSTSTPKPRAEGSSPSAPAKNREVSRALTSLFFVSVQKDSATRCGCALRSACRGALVACGDRPALTEAAAETSPSLDFLLAFRVFSSGFTRSQLFPSPPAPRTHPVSPFLG